MGANVITTDFALFYPRQHSFTCWLYYLQGESQPVLLIHICALHTQTHSACSKASIPLSAQSNASCASSNQQVRLLKQLQTVVSKACLTTKSPLICSPELLFSVHLLLFQSSSIFSFHLRGECLRNKFHFKFLSKHQNFFLVLRTSVNLVEEM